MPLLRGSGNACHSDHVAPCIYLLNSGAQNETTPVFRGHSHFAAFFCAAQRAFCAAAIRARPSALIVLFFAFFAGAAFTVAPGLRPLFLGAVVPESNARACWSRAISASI